MLFLRILYERQVSIGAGGINFNTILIFRILPNPIGITENSISLHYGLQALMKEFESLYLRIQAIASFAFGCVIPLLQ